MYDRSADLTTLMERSLPESVRLAEKIEMRDVAKLVPYAGNARTHPAKQVKQIMASIEEFGFTNPILVDDDGKIVAGHGRVLAAKELSMGQVPCINVAYLSDAQRRAYIIADNKIAANAGWDDELLAIELSDLATLGFDVQLTGFSEKDLKHLGVGGMGEGGDAPMEEPPTSWAVIIECTNEDQQVELIERLQTEGFKVRGSIA